MRSTFRRPRLSRAFATAGVGKPKVIVLSGPTGAGKSALSVDLAKKLGGEIVSYDSVQLYRHMDIGSNKVPKAIRDEIPHHLIDVAEPEHGLTVAEFYTLARQATAEILSRDKVPIVVGGSWLYARWFLYGAAPVGGTEAQRREDFLSLVQQCLASADPAAELDRRIDALPAPVTAAGKDYLRSIKRDDVFRLSRAFEIVTATGGPPQQHHIPQLQDLPAMEYDFRCFFLDAPRLWLNRQLDYRCELMLHEGLLEEVASLRAKGLATDTIRGRTLGFFQALQFLERHHAELAADAAAAKDHGQAKGDPRSRPVPAAVSAGPAFLDFLDRFQSASRQIARRQLNSFSQDPVWRWVSISAPEVPSDLRKLQHPLSYSLDPAHWASLVSNIEAEFAKPAAAYWSHHLSESEQRRQQELRMLNRPYASPKSVADPASSRARATPLARQQQSPAAVKLADDLRRYTSALFLFRSEQDIRQLLERYGNFALTSGTPQASDKLSWLQSLRSDADFARPRLGLRHPGPSSSKPPIGADELQRRLKAVRAMPQRFRASATQSGPAGADLARGHHPGLVGFVKH